MQNPTIYIETENACRILEKIQSNMEFKEQDPYCQTALEAAQWHLNIFKRKLKTGKTGIIKKQ